MRDEGALRNPGAEVEVMHGDQQRAKAAPAVEDEEPWFGNDALQRRFAVIGLVNHKRPGELSDRISHIEAFVRCDYNSAVCRISTLKVDFMFLLQPR